MEDERNEGDGQAVPAVAPATAAPRATEDQGGDTDGAEQ